MIFHMKQRETYRVLIKKGVMAAVMMRSILNIFVRFALYIPLKQVSTKYIKVMNLSGVLIFQDIVQCFQCLSLIILN